MLQRAIITWLLAATLGAVAVVAGELSTAPGEIRAGATSWPLFRGDPQATGVAVSALPKKLSVLWKRSFKDAAFESTPVIVDGVVYIGGLDGHFRALDLASGEQKWQFDEGELGYKAAAAVRDGRLYIGDGDGKFYCLDAASGKKLWAINTDAEINGSANFYGPAVLVGSQDGTLYGIHAVSGKVQWKYTIENMIQCSPTLVDNRVFIAGCDGKLHVVELAQAADGSETKIIDKTTIDINDPTGATPAAVGDVVYFGTQGASFLCIDWKQGKILWTYQPKRKQPFQSSAAVLGDVVVVGGRDRVVHALEAKTGTPLWTFPCRSRIDCSPVIVDKRVFIGAGDGRLYALDLKSGETVWEYEAGGGFTGSPAVADGRLVIGNDDGELFCFGTK